jgi:hypothetical protein
MWPVLIARTNCDYTYTRIVYPDYIIYDLHVGPYIALYHHMRAGDVNDTTSSDVSVNITSTDIPKYLVGHQYALRGGFGRRLVTSDLIEALSHICYYKCQSDKDRWMVITGSDDHVRALCEAIDAEMFF